MDFEQDYYALIGVSADASERDIKRAYRQLARRYHPDTTTEENAAEIFHQIQEAYQILIDEHQRELYDQWRARQGFDGPSPLTLRLTPSQGVMPCLGEAQALYVLLELLASEEIQSPRLPLNLCLILDRSTSMRGARLQQVKEAARFIIGQMAPDDVLTLVVFSDRAQVVLPGRRGFDRAEATRAISGVRAGGGTEILQGLKLGFQEVQRFTDSSKEQIDHMILLTDGQTYGDEEGCLALAAEAGQLRIPITTMGIGSDWNDELLDQVSMRSGSLGGSIYIDSSAKIARAFHDRVHGLGSIFAQDVTMSLHFSKGVWLDSAFQVAPQMSPLRVDGNLMKLGALERQNPQAVVLELLVESHNPGAHRLLRVDVECHVPAMGNQRARVQKTLTMSFDADLDRRLLIPPDIVSAMGKLTVYKMQERAMSEIEGGQIDEAVQRLKTMATRLLSLGETELARVALLEAGRLAHTGGLSAEGRKQIRYGTKGLSILPKGARE